MMLLPLVEIAFKPELMMPAAALSVAAAEGCLRPIAWATLVSRSVAGGSNRLGPIAWATCTARSQLVRISISAPMTLSVSVAGRAASVLCLDRVDGAPFQNIAHQQLGL